MVLTSTSWILIVVAAILIVAGLVCFGLGLRKHGYQGIHSTTKEHVSVLWRALFWGGIVATVVGAVMLIVVLVWGHKHRDASTSMAARRPTATVYDTYPGEFPVKRTVRTSST